MDQALKLNLEDRTINFEWSNQIAQKCRKYQPDRVELEDQIGVTNQFFRMEKK